MLIIFTFLGGSKFVGPETKITSAPLSLASFAIAYPILPVDLLVIYLTGSIGAIVGPALTSTFFPNKSCSLSSSSSITLSTIVFTSANLPIPISPHANLPLAGSINLYPKSFNFEILF